MHADLERLGSITRSLPKFPLAIAELTNGVGFKAYKVSRGTALAWNLLSEDAIGVARSFGSAGTVFDAHAHKEREWILVYEGEMVLRWRGKDRRILAGEFFCVDPGEEHSARFSEDTWYLAITIPRSPDWPTNKETP